MNLTLRSRATRSLLAVSLTGMVALAACGSSSAKGADASTASSKAASGGSSSESSTESSSGGASTASSAAESSSETTAKSSGKASSSGDIATGMVAAFKAVDKGDCGRADELGNDINFGDSGDQADMSASLSGLAKGMSELAKSGPDALKADFATLSKAFGDIAKAYEGLDLSDPAKLSSVMSDPAKAAEIAKLGQSMDSAEVKKAEDNIDKWMNERCPGLNDDESTDSSNG